MKKLSRFRQNIERENKWLRCELIIYSKSKFHFGDVIQKYNRLLCYSYKEVNYLINKFRWYHETFRPIRD